MGGMSVSHAPAGRERVAEAPRIVLRYDVQGHEVRLTQLVPGRWAVALDEEQLAGSFDSRADAWEAGVREADRRNSTLRSA